MRLANAVRTAFPHAPPDIHCIDPNYNLFDGGPEGGGENDITAMMFCLNDRAEVLRDHIDPDCGVILVGYTRKLSNHQVRYFTFIDFIEVLAAREIKISVDGI